MINNNGLSDEEVLESRQRYGENIFSKKKQETFLKLLLETFGYPIYPGIVTGEFIRQKKDIKVMKQVRKKSIERLRDNYK